MINEKKRIRQNISTENEIVESRINGKGNTNKMVYRRRVGEKPSLILLKNLDILL
jgi:hypothetical protein